MTIRKPSDLRLRLELELETSAWRLDDTAVECWVASARAACDDDSVEIGSAVMYRVDNSQTLDPAFELDCISADLGRIASDIYLEEHPALESVVWPGAQRTTVIADRVALDPVWRGKRLGPALLVWASDALRADAVFLTPAAVQTRRSSSGEVYLDYDLPRGTPSEKAKVIAAWKRAGFKRLSPNVMWRLHEFERDRPWSIDQFQQFERELQSSAGLLWFRRRLRR